MESRYELLNNGKYSLYCMEKYMKFKFGEEQQSLEEEEFNECSKMNNCIRQRKSRQMNEILRWTFAKTHNTVYGKYIMVFGTLTFRENVLETTSKQTRRRYVARFLKENTRKYIANIDFGKKENREHYHFIALCEKKITKDSWKYGWDSYRQIKNYKDLKKTKNYLFKLNNHSFKDSTHQERTIKSRNKDILDLFIMINEREFKNFKGYFYQCI